MTRDQGPHTREGGARITSGISKPIKTVSTDWFLLVLCWAFTTLFAATVVLGVGLFY